MSFEKELDTARANEPLEGHVRALAQLRNSNVLRVLRELGRPHKKHNEDMAAEGLYSAGWQDCLDALENFADKWLMPEKSKLPRMDFKSLDVLRQNPSFSKEELDAIRNNTPVNYGDIGTRFSGNLAPPNKAE